MARLKVRQPGPPAEAVPGEIRRGAAAPQDRRHAGRMSRAFHHGLLALLLVGVLLQASAATQEGGGVRGTVSFGDSGDPVHGAVVLVVGTSSATLSGEDGTFELANVAPGDYEVFAQREHFSAARQSITVQANALTTVNFRLDLSTIHEELTVTATAGGQETAFEAFNAITTLDSFELIGDPQSTLGGALQNEPGVAKRSFGPGSSRPIIRGFDGDRVLILENGIRTGDLSGQSGDHGVTIDPNGLDRIEIVRGPATLLYGSNAVGGVVNAITPHEGYLDAIAEGTRGQVSADAGSADQQAGTNASLQHADGRVVVWLAGGTRATGDYATPVGVIENTATQLSSGRAGIGYFGDRVFASGGFTAENSLFGVPFAGAFHGHEPDALVDIDSRRRVSRFDFGMHNLASNLIDGFRVVLNVVDWAHNEIESDEGFRELGTAFDNGTTVIRAEVDQKQNSRLAGKFGVWTQARNYVATGEEALSPPTDQTSFAAFVYEELDFGRYRMQFGGRVEQNDYVVAERQSGHDEDTGLEPPDVRNRDFSGASASIGFQADLPGNTALVANVTRSHRAPALEELYNFGPHVGSLLFEVGNPGLEDETTLGLDVSLRHQTPRAKTSVNGYVYDIHNFVFASVTDEVADTLRVAHFLQDDSRFLGFDAEASARLGGAIWASIGLSLVNAKLATGESLPRIPPFRTRFNVDIPYRGFTISPELIVAAAQDQVFRDETETGGYAVVNLKASYVWPRRHMAHILSLTGYNLTNALYRHHTSFIKDLAPEIGRGVKVGYSMRFF